jgi:hypothetical protein
MGFDIFSSVKIYIVVSLPTSGGRSVDTVRWRTKAPEFFFPD